MTFGTFNADQFRHELANYTEAELIKLGRSVPHASAFALHHSTNRSGRGVRVVHLRLTAPAHQAPDC